MEAWLPEDKDYAGFVKPLAQHNQPFGLIENEKIVETTSVVPDDFAVEYQYHHCRLDVVDGKPSLDVLPYRPTEYPEADVDVMWYHHAGDNKYWAVSKDGKLSFYSNSKTNNVLVCQSLKGTASAMSRASQKTQKGYIQVSLNARFCATTRSLKS